MSRDEELVLHEEQAVVGTEQVPVGTARASKRIETHTETLTVDRGTEHADLQREPAVEGDDGKVHVLEDGSVSIPVMEEQIVVTKRLVVRERVVLRKHTVYEEHTVSADLRREQLDVDVDLAVQDRVTRS
jgi:uncharacterized protein (TIGR02271 family)